MGLLFLSKMVSASNCWSLEEKALCCSFDATMGVCEVAGAEEEGVDEDRKGGVVVQLRQIKPSLRLVLGPLRLLAERVIF